MGKGKRLRATRQTGATKRRMVVVDGMEVGQVHGALTLRMGPTNRPPLAVALPAEVLDGALANLRAASLHAEETYWDLLQWFAATQADPADPVAYAAAMEKWLLRQDWDTTLKTADPMGAHPLFLITNFAHVGLAVRAPFTHQPALAVIDPMQLRRVDGSLHTAAEQARAEAAVSGMDPQRRAAHALAFLDDRPWPVTRFPDPSRQEAEAFARQKRVEFLAREPFLLPEENMARPPASPAPS